MIDVTEDRLCVPLQVLRSLYLSQSSRPDAVNGPLDNVTVLVAGGAGFVGSHLVDRLMLLGACVVVVDDLSTGQLANIQHWLHNPKFNFIKDDVVSVKLVMNCDYVFNLASPASPPHYQKDPVRTLMINVQGTLNLLQYALDKKCRRFLLASTSEVYGDPEVHPQCESYCGAVNTIGPRACYDEGKRCAETLASDFNRQYGLDVVIVRIFNTFGPRMQPNDGRVVSNFIVHALQGEPLIVHGDGKQTRSFQFVHDLVDAMMLSMFVAKTDRHSALPINIGYPEERTIEEFAKIIIKLTGSNCSQIQYGPPAIDDPRKRRPDIKRATEVLKWTPKWSFLEDGLQETIQYFKIAHNNV